MRDQHTTTSPRLSAPHGWRELTDDELHRYRTSYARALALVDEETDDDVREGTRDFLALLLADAEHEEARRAYAATLGVPRDRPAFPPDLVAELKRRVHLDQLLEYEAGATLGRASPGGVRRGPCPFCGTSDHSTSLRVDTGDPDNQHFYCFACTTAGDAVSAIEIIYRLDFAAAVRHLARDAGLALPTPPRAAHPATGRMIVPLKGEAPR